MREFFQGWRRKAGLATLAMAVALFGAWMRSIVIADIVTIDSQASSQSFCSLLGGMRWVRSTGGMRGIGGMWADDPRPRWRSLNAARYHEEPFEMSDIKWRRKWGGFDFVAATIRDTSRDIELVRWAIPYWSLVLPLTLISAWLLLIKPRPAKSAKEFSRA